MSNVFEFYHENRTNFASDETIDALLNPAAFPGKKVSRRDIRASAERLLGEFNLHPAFVIAKFVEGSDDREENTRTAEMRSKVTDAFTGGSIMQKSDMLVAHERICEVGRTLLKTKEDLRLCTTRTLANELKTSFEELSNIDAVFDRQTMIVRFNHHLKTGNIAAKRETLFIDSLISSLREEPSPYQPPGTQGP